MQELLTKATTETARATTTKTTTEDNADSRAEPPTENRPEHQHDFIMSGLPAPPGFHGSSERAHGGDCRFISPPVVSIASSSALQWDRLECACPTGASPLCPTGASPLCPTGASPIAMALTEENVMALAWQNPRRSGKTIPWDDYPDQYCDNGCGRLLKRRYNDPEVESKVYQLRAGRFICEVCCGPARARPMLSSRL